MYGTADTNGDDVAQSFLDKTFDLVFRVAPPVLSDWQSYLEKTLKEAFGNLATDHDVYGTIKLYAAFLATQSKADRRSQNITPRTIIKLVNLIATLRLQHRADVSLIAIAYYAIHKARIENDISSIIESLDAEIARFESDWRESIAAIYYNIPRAKALQVLMQPEIQAAIAQGDADAFGKLAVVPGFDALLEQIVEQMTRPTDPEFVTNAAYLIKSAKLLFNPRISSIHRNLIASMNEPQPWKRITQIAGLGISALFDACSPSNAFSLANATFKSLRGLTVELAAKTDTPKQWALAARVTFEFAKRLRGQGIIGRSTRRTLVLSYGCGECRRKSRVSG